MNMPNPFKYLKVPVTMTHEQAQSITNGERCTLTFAGGALISFSTEGKVEPIQAINLTLGDANG